jgi:hypothetical protein
VLIIQLRDEEKKTKRQVGPDLSRQLSFKITTVMVAG